jgi:hypothetical protein
MERWRDGWMDGMEMDGRMEVKKRKEKKTKKRELRRNMSFYTSLGSFCAQNCDTFCQDLDSPPQRHIFAKMAPLYSMGVMSFV